MASAVTGLVHVTAALPVQWSWGVTLQSHSRDHSEACRPVQVFGHGLGEAEQWKAGITCGTGGMEERPVQTGTKEGEAGVMWQPQNQTPKAACCPMPFNTQHANVTQSPRGFFPVERTSLSANTGLAQTQKENAVHSQLTHLLTSRSV